MKRAWIILVVLAVAMLAGPAEAQLEVGVPNIAPGGGRVVSEMNISIRVQGEMVVAFHGDAATGCAARGVCQYSGTIVVRPRSGLVNAVTYRRNGRLRHFVFFLVGAPENAYTTWARVVRSITGVAAGTCADAESATGGVSLASPSGAVVRVRLFHPGGSLLQTRCAGPTDGDLSEAGPATTIRLSRLLRGRTTLDLSGSQSFASHGFAGTIDSTLRLQLGRPSSQPPNGNFPPGTKTQRVRTVTEQLSLVRVRGRLTATAQGVGNPIVCGLLDSCGLRETLSLTGPMRDVFAQLVATGPARRPVADFLAALGLSRTGRPRGIAVSGSLDWVQPVRAAVSQAGNLCADTAPSGGVEIGFGPRRASGGFTETWRTRCPGPSLADVQPFMTGPLDRSALGRHQFGINIAGKDAFSDDGYVILARGRLSLVVRRGRITQQVSTEPGY